MEYSFDFCNIRLSILTWNLKWRSYVIWNLLDKIVPVWFSGENCVNLEMPIKDHVLWKCPNLLAKPIPPPPCLLESQPWLWWGFSYFIPVNLNMQCLESSIARVTQGLTCLGENTRHFMSPPPTPSAWTHVHIVKSPVRFCFNVKLVKDHQDINEEANSQNHTHLFFNHKL